MAIKCCKSADNSMYLSTIQIELLTKMGIIKYKSGHLPGYIAPSFFTFLKFLFYFLNTFLSIYICDKVIVPQQ